SYSSGSTVKNSDYVYNANYLTLPAMVMFRTPAFGPEMRVKFGAGIQPMILMGGQYEYKGNDPLEKVIYPQKSKVFVQPIDVAMVVNAGIEYPIEGVGAIEAGLLFNLGFIKTEIKKPKIEYTSATGSSETIERDIEQDGNYMNFNDNAPANNNMMFGVQLGFLFGTVDK
ncbi:MAG: hypothetical protein NZ108_09555, partial [Bacteroidia bacterium]|nr:hypothetical protein [Bacteroidia bacterium]